MKNKISKKEFEEGELKLDQLLSIASQKGGFEDLTGKENASLDMYTKIVKDYEGQNYVMPLPQTVQGLIELKMYEKKLKQKEIAKMLNTTDTKLSEIMHNKRKPSLSFIKAMNEVLEIDGNLLLKIA